MNTYNVIKEVNSSTIVLDNLDEFIGKKIEININIYDDKINKQKVKNLRGILKRKDSPALISEEKEAWKLAAKEKHDN